ncbi:GNAT family N-acetyltransferase [Paenibacillus sp. J22TS3]|uniref:GNAT family N-acetyltransferase n=1 Tax=Paenibacillus sp. J22TS3 TaxID=2807192 RepID=UPI001B044AE1|nr:GNAT family N-acetyltransferase [Paenibacillus sp. J22TS3]GIP22691.1 alanine acetyltransferase [Paenibacillus sp. J22TS3]
MFREKVTSERLILRVVDESNAPRILEFVIRNKEHLAEWEPAREPEYYTLAYQRQLIMGDMRNMAGGQLYKLWMFKSDQPDSPVIGSISLSNIARGAFLSCHMGYRLDAAELNQGYMTEAVRCVVDLAFRELGLHRIEANIMPRNEASLSVVRKCGFQSEGLARKYLCINGKWEDHVHMVLLNEAME